MACLDLRSPRAIASFSAVIVLLLPGCGELKSATPGATVDETVPAHTPAGSLVGPGDHGSLPSGYCCTEDDQCRDRHCADVGSGGRMCLDACTEQGTCTNHDIVFTCDSDGHEDGWCQPPSPSFACIPQANFQRGTRAVGECCAWTGDGTAGEECEGNKCIGIGHNGDDGPLVCSHSCDSTKDCPGGTVCGPWGTCDPANFPYTCK